jgi:hypothetical protein
VRGSVDDEAYFVEYLGVGRGREAKGGSQVGGGKESSYIV